MSSQEYERETEHAMQKSHHQAPLRKRVVAEAVGTGMLLVAIVGSGIMGERLAAGNVAIALLGNSLAPHKAEKKHGN
jgi:glycerol uptake facilitator-like aquaporin